MKLLSPFCAAAFLAIALTATAQSHSKCQASPEPVTITQADGTTLTIIGHGNIDESHTETLDGYTVLPVEGVYYYAQLDQRGHLVPSNVKAVSPSARSEEAAQMRSATPKHLRMPAEQRHLMKPQQAPTQPGYKDHFDDHKSIVGSYPNKGKVNILVILFQFPDLKATHSPQDFWKLMNEENYNGTGSFRDFFLENSFGQFETEADVTRWYTAPSSYLDYGRDLGNGVLQPILKAFIDSAYQDGVDFSKYDNDGDGTVDGVMFIHSGPGAEEGSQTQYIWSHRWQLFGTGRTFGGKTFSHYAINPERRSSGMVNIGVYCHEFGHLLGLPDLYDTDKDNGESAGLGNWSLMAGGCWLDNERSPASMDAWCKLALEWIIPSFASEDKMYTLRPASQYPEVLWIPSPSPNEYFLLENRQWRNFDRKLPGKGLAVYKINQNTLAWGLSMNRVNADTAAYGVHLLQADGKRDLERNINRGDAGDLFPNGNKTEVNDDTNPWLRASGGTKSNILISGITQNADLTVSFAFGALPQPVFEIPSVICQNKTVQLNNLSKFANRFEWEFGNGTTDTAFSPAITFTNPGPHTVKLTAYNNEGVSFISEKTVNVTVSAQASFEAVADGMQVHITNSSTSATHYIWNWDDGKQSFEKGSQFARTYREEGTYTIQLVAFGSNWCNDTTYQTITVGAAGMASLPQPKISLYPNPASSTLMLEASVGLSGKGLLSIYDATGREMTGKMVFVNDGKPLDLTSEVAPLGKGVYVVSLTVGDARYNCRFVKL